MLITLTLGSFGFDSFKINVHLFAILIVFCIASFLSKNSLSISLELLKYVSGLAFILVESDSVVDWCIVIKQSWASYIPLFRNEILLLQVIGTSNSYDRFSKLASLIVNVLLLALNRSIYSLSPKSSKSFLKKGHSNNIFSIIFFSLIELNRRISPLLFSIKSFIETNFLFNFLKFKYDLLTKYDKFFHPSWFIIRKVKFNKNFSSIITSKNSMFILAPSIGWIFLIRAFWVNSIAPNRFPLSVSAIEDIFSFKAASIKSSIFIDPSRIE